MKFIKSNLDPVDIQINGTPYPAKLTFRALAELEELTGTTFLRLFAKMEATSLSTEELLKIAYVSLKGGGVDITLDDLYDNDFEIDSTNEMMDKIGALLSRTMNVVSMLEKPKDGEDNKKKMEGTD